MGHITGKDIYRRLGEKIDNLTIKAPWNEALHGILKNLYTVEEAELVVKMPYNLSGLERISKVTGYEGARLESMLHGLAEKGLVVDLFHAGEYYYMPSPFMVGIFELVMMKAGPGVDIKKHAEMIHAYLAGDGTFYRANCGEGQQVAITRAIPHDGTVVEEDVVEILPYEKAGAIVESHSLFAVGTCSCRHEKMHNNLKDCDTPLETCLSFGAAAGYLTRHGFAREISRHEVMEILEKSRQMGLVISADNVKRNVKFICCCCSCCCNMLLGINKFGYTNFVMTSSFIARVDPEKCTGCGKCAAVCPVKNIKMVSSGDGENAKRMLARVDKNFCLGCGVCALQCRNGAIELKKRKQKVLHPESTFERNILACLERGTLQNYIFDNPQAITHRIMRGILGGFLRLPPVKKGLVSGVFRSAFLRALTANARLSGKGWITEI